MGYLNPVRIRVLHVDDEPEVLKLTQVFLRREGEFEITSVFSAEEALAKLESEHFDVIIADYNMLGMDGLEFLKEVRENRGSIPFVFFSGIEDPEIIEEAWKKGADRYVTKTGNPAFTWKELAQAVQELMMGKKEVELQREEEEVVIRSCYGIKNVEARGVIVTKK